jgi:hypothetical protein
MVGMVSVGGRHRGRSGARLHHGMIDDRGTEADKGATMAPSTSHRVWSTDRMTIPSLSCGPHRETHCSIPVRHPCGERVQRDAGNAWMMDGGCRSSRCTGRNHPRPGRSRCFSSAARDGGIVSESAQMGNVVSNACDDLRGAQMVPARDERGNNGSVRFGTDVLLVVQQVVHESCPRPDDEMHHDVGRQMGPHLCDVG